MKQPRTALETRRSSSRFSSAFTAVMLSEIVFFLLLYKARAATAQAQASQRLHRHVAKWTKRCRFGAIDGSFDCKTCEEVPARHRFAQGTPQQLR